MTTEELKDNLSTGDVIMKRNGFVMNTPALDNWPSEEVKFLIAEEVEEIGKQVIKRYREDLKGLNIAYVFKPKATKSKGNVTLGQVSAESELQKTLHGYDAKMLIGFDTWETLDPDGKFRLVYHELEHYGIDPETGKLTMIPHAVEEFPSVVKVFGLGQSSHVDFVHAWETFKKDNGR